MLDYHRILMDDVIEIDLRKIIRDLLAHWVWIVGITFLVGAAAFLASYLQPRNYTANALIAITAPRYLPNFDPQYQTVSIKPPTNAAIMQLATSDEIVQRLYKLWQSPAKANTTPEQFRTQYLQTANGSDPSIVVLKVTADTPEQAATLANAWAQDTYSRANQLFSGIDGAQVDDFKAQVDAAETSMAATQTALADFESRDQTAILNNQLSSLLAQQADSLRKQRLIDNAVSDANGLVAQLDGQTDGSTVPNALQTNFMVLQLRIYNDPSLVSSTTNSNANSMAGATALQIQLPNQSAGIPITLPDQTSIQTITKAVFSSRVQAWVNTLKAQSADLQTSLSTLTSQITALQKQIQDQTSEKDRLTMNYKNSQDVYSTMVLKYQEVQITNNDLYGNTQIASLASAPSKPDSHNTIRNTAIGLFVGGLLSVILVLVVEWWRGQPAPEDK
jgi:uncharacterized protein involved in exopolysaccharide biosynthesis